LALRALLFLGEMVPHGTSGHGPDNGMMACHVSCHGAHGSTLDATARFDVV
jgi:hypothetical protein